MLRTLHEGLEAMVEVHAVWLVPEYGIGQRGLKIGAMNLMIIRTKSFDIVGSVCPGFYDHTGLEMAYQVAFPLRDLLAYSNWAGLTGLGSCFPAVSPSAFLY